MRHRRCARQRQTRNHRKNGGESNRWNKAEEQVATHCIRQVNCRHVVTTNQMARRVFIFRIRTNQHDRAEADNKGQNIEVAHKSGSVEHALTRFAGIADRKEAHQNVRQASRTKHQP